VATSQRLFWAIVSSVTVAWCIFSHMARKQTRRSISINCLNYEAIQQAAASRGMTVAGLVEFALSAVGVPVVAHAQQSPALAGSIAARRSDRGLHRRSVSINRRIYEAAKQGVAGRGVSIAGLVGLALSTIGVSAGARGQSLSGLPGSLAVSRVDSASEDGLLA
jgi:predicted DNA-binding ribbon-helix-helix protein